MSASRDRGRGRNPDPERPDDGQMDHSFPPSQKTNNLGRGANGPHASESSQDTPQRECLSRKYNILLCKVKSRGMTYMANQEYLARTQKQFNNAEMDLDGENSQASTSTGGDGTQGAPGASQDWTMVDMHRHRKLSLKIRVANLKKGTHQERLQDVFWIVTSMRANLVSTPVWFRYRGEEYYQVTPVGKDDYDSLADIVCDEFTAGEAGCLGQDSGTVRDPAAGGHGSA
ncbi:hypothetical protein BGZ51_003679 [Haplosporangium sp. Z 767]|nr:hypothetical protein BGZ51_003679 [Haplosporangium sp. Z 767]KAF9184523.1 hypothetical protein BGZ50_003623 [Haplosporangium sp. Z 11]